MSNHRYIKFWPQDWQLDKQLRMCSLAARGLWMELLCIAHDGEPVGHITVGGEAPTVADIASLVGRSNEREVGRLLQELEGRGVFSRTAEGVIFSRRMVKDAAKSADGASAVALRWGSGEQSGSSRSQRLAAARKLGTHSDVEWQELVNIVGNQCPKCSRPHGLNGGGFVKDHVIPVYKGGSDAIDNLQPLCQRCNASKGPDTTDYRPSDWRERLQERLQERLGGLGVSRAETSTLLHIQNHRSESLSYAGAREAPPPEEFFIREKEESRPNGHRETGPASTDPAMNAVIVSIARELRSTNPIQPPKRTPAEQIAAITPQPTPREPLRIQEPIRTVEEQLAILRGEKTA